MAYLNLKKIMQLGTVICSFLLLELAHATNVGGELQREGFCAMLGDCGKRSLFGGQLPCSNYSKAIIPSKDLKTNLKRICGSDFDTERVCCTEEQVANLESNLKRVEPLIGSCPACQKNFYDFFCEFTCSSNQAKFINVTKVAKSMDGRDVVTEVVQYVNGTYAEKFYDSCKDIKFSATNDYAMQLLGGGAKNYKEFLKFLGDEKPLLGGSPFQINTKYMLEEQDEREGFRLRGHNAKLCDDENYKCACSDCSLTCPKLPNFKKIGERCTVASMPCFSFIVMVVWIFLIVMLGAYHVYLARKKTRFFEQMNRIFENDTSQCFDEDVTRDPLIYSHESENRNSLDLEKYQQKLDTLLQKIFNRIGHICAGSPLTCLAISLLIGVLFSLGLFRLELEKDPVNLWVSPLEPALDQMKYFLNNFGEWYRIEQLIISSKNESEPFLNWKNIQWWFDKEKQLQEVSSNDNLTLNTFCYKPLGETCAIESFAQYFNGDISNLKESTWKEQINSCANSPVNCLPSFQQPLKKNILFSADNVTEAGAIIITLLLQNDSTNKTYTNEVISFEHTLKEWIIDLLHEREDLNIAFSTEISLTEELDRSTTMDIKIIIISYGLMFLYASLALGGRVPRELNWRALLRTRFILGLGGILIIFLSVLSAAGVCSFIGLKSTLIIAEVIPFLILAIGIDNIFLIVHEVHLVSETNAQALIQERISISLGNIGPSCLISTVLQFSMFLLAARVPMPAVRNFAIYSATALFLNFSLQMTTFVSLLALDQKRLEDGRADLFPWIKVTGALNLEEEGGNNEDVNEEYNFGNFIATKYIPKIFKKMNLRKIITFYFIWIGIALSILPLIDVGLDQRLALPYDSYLIKYFDSVYKYLNVGPPIFFVISNEDYTKKPIQKELCGRFSGCNEFSVANILEQEFKRKDRSTIAEPISNWLDDFLSWLNPNLDECCRVKKKSPLFEVDFCGPHTPKRLCQSCFADHDPPYDTSMEGFPENEEFLTYFNHWIEQPSDPCPLGGKAPYSNSISLSKNRSSIVSSYFRTSHVPLRSQNDYIVAYQNALRIVQEVKSYVEDIDIFAFSPFYVFFVQYVGIYRLAFKLLGLGMVIIWFLALLLFGSFVSATVLVFTVLMILISMGAILSLWSISLNAVSLVNLVICLGLAVEFTTHLIRAFTIFRSAKAALPRNPVYEEDAAPDATSDTAILDSSALKALTKVGGSVLGGITLTKFIGICVLAFAKSKIYEVYYFRMWFSLVCVAAIHALCILPIFLSYFE